LVSGNDIDAAVTEVNSAIGQLGVQQVYGRRGL
jgi:hypothetical protein